MIRQPVTREEAIKQYQTILLEESFKKSKRLSDLRTMVTALQSRKTVKELYEFADSMQLSGEEHWSHFLLDISWIKEDGDL